MIHQAITLAPDENIIHIVRRHWFHLAVVAVVDACIFVVGLAVINYTATTFGVAGSSKSLLLGVYGTALLGLALWMHFFAVWTDYWLDAWVITDTRIIDIEQKGFFSREVSSFPLTRIQDVTYEVHGILAMWLHFGDVRVQTASVSTDLIMRQVGNPDFVKEEVLKIITRYRT